MRLGVLVASAIAASITMSAGVSAEQSLNYTGTLPAACKGLSEGSPSCFVGLNGTEQCTVDYDSEFSHCLDKHEVPIDQRFYNNKPITLPSMDGPTPYSKAEVDEDRLVWHGSMDLIPCTKTDFETLTTTIADQTYDATIKMRIHGAREIVDAVYQKAQQCAYGAATAGVVAGIFSGSSAGWPAFKATFIACAEAQSITEYIGEMTLDVDSHCHW
jgi:hypothetical protein